MTLQEIVKQVASEYQCNCDLDNWEPKPNTGHSHVCRIHRIALERFRRQEEKK